MHTSTESTVRIGALAPLGPPGWVDAGRHLLAGLELAAAEANAAGGIGGRPLELLVRDTAASPERAAEAVEGFARSGAVAVVGEYHSVVARAAAGRAAALGLPFLCSSAVLDALVEEPTDAVARIAPAQSRGWRLYADHLAAEGHRRVAVATEPSAYWAAGAGILAARLAEHGGGITELDARALSPEALCDALAADGATALLLLTGFPDPAVPILRAVRRDPRLAGLLVGAPAGQPELPSWAGQAGAGGAGVPFLRYLPAEPGPLALRVGAALRERLGEEPSFVAYEGWDTVTVLVEALRAHGTGRAGLTGAWPRLAVDGTRGTIRFSRPPGIDVWQWAWAPIEVVDRDPADPTRFRTLRTAGTPDAG
ncbi:ABC transporter substrate-binding protein (plasmid) [Streptomyces sp. BI20]|uniref:ABC transporter substrate-binding protein n=1 Tax=Streptomyces sp. BI20 TaxID=3403460 RepID=UPI003C7595EE